jgi:hypothetical protein
MTNRWELGSTFVAGVFVTVFLHAACGEAVPGVRSAQLPTTPSVTPALSSPAARTVVISELDDSATVVVSVGDLVQLSLRGQFLWSVELRPEGILAAVPGETVPFHGTPRVARAVTPGTATLVARAVPNCAPNQPCVQLAGVHLTIVVH